MLLFLFFLQFYIGDHIVRHIEIHLKKIQLHSYKKRSKSLNFKF